jgi:multidrug efflux pump subunit AcrA (membrane-fusion protein)
MTTQHNPKKTGKRILRWSMIVIVIIIMILPYPFEVGGPFKFLPIKYFEVHAPISGEINKILVKEGERVKKDQIIALLDTRDHQKNFDVIRADLDKAMADLRLMRPEQFLMNNMKEYLKKQ